MCVCTASPPSIIHKELAPMARSVRYWVPNPGRLGCFSSRLYIYTVYNSKKKQAVNNNATQVNRLPSFQPNQGKVRKSHKQINDDKLKQPKKHVQNNKKYKQQAADQPKTLSEQPLCDFCGVTGHMSKACRFGSAVTCYLCGEKKHKANRCPSK